MTTTSPWRIPLVAIAVAGFLVGMTISLVVTFGAHSTAKPLVVTIAVSRTVVSSGTVIPATVTLINRTDHSLQVGGCPQDLFKMTVGNTSVPNNLILQAVFCEWSLAPGTHVFHTDVTTTYQRSAAQGRFPALPAGTYRTEIGLLDNSDFLAPAPITIHLTN